MGALLGALRCFLLPRLDRPCSSCPGWLSTQVPKAQGPGSAQTALAGEGHLWAHWWLVSAPPDASFPFLTVPEPV